MRQWFYNEQARLDGGLRSLAYSGLSASNQQTIRDFSTALLAEGVGCLRVVKYIYHLKTIGRLLAKEFADATRADLIRVFAEIESRQYSPHTKKDFKAVCKRFYQWIRGSDDEPPEVKWIKITLKVSRRKLPEEMLTGEDLRRLVGVAGTARDRALALVQITTMADALAFRFLIWLGFFATTMLGKVLWEGSSAKLYALNAVHYLVVLLVASAILANM